MKLKVQNVLDETVEIERAGVVTFSEAPGIAVSLKVKYDFSAPKATPRDPVKGCHGAIVSGQLRFVLGALSLMLQWSLR